jgi:uncharacterized membrane protein YphA (DoxX/SURF4 family)
MTTEQKPSKLLNVLLWIAQIVLASSLIWAASLKLFQTPDKLALMWPWTEGHSLLVKLTGIVDLILGIGLVLPTLLHIQPQLTRYAAYGTIVLMVAATAFHISRGEASLIGVNLFFAVFAGFIAWGRRA